MAQTKQHERQNTQDVAPDSRGEMDARSDPNTRTTPEKVTTAISILLICLLAGLILYEGYFSGQSDPARLTVTVLTEQIEQRGEQFYVPVEIVNEGDETVEEVLVSIEVFDGETIVSEAETTIASLAEDEMVEAVLVLDDDPAALTVEATIVTFQVAEG